MPLGKIFKKRHTRYVKPLQSITYNPTAIAGKVVRNSDKVKLDRPCGIVDAVWVAEAYEKPMARFPRNDTENGSKFPVTVCNGRDCKALDYGAMNGACSLCVIMVVLFCVHKICFWMGISRDAFRAPHKTMGVQVYGTAIQNRNVFRTIG